MNYITCYRHYTNKRSDPQQRSIIFYPRNIYCSPPWHEVRQGHRDRCRPAGITGRKKPAQGVGMQSIKCNTLNRLPLLRIQSKQPPAPSCTGDTAGGGPQSLRTKRTGNGAGYRAEILQIKQGISTGPPPLPGLVLVTRTDSRTAGRGHGGRGWHGEITEKIFFYFLFFFPGRYGAGIPLKHQNLALPPLSVHESSGRKV